MSSCDSDPTNQSGNKAPYFEPYSEKAVPIATETPQEPKCYQQEALEDLTRQRTDPSNYPEGGFKAWLVIFGSFCGATSCFGLMNTIGVIHSYIANNILEQYSDGTIGWIFSIYLFISMAGGVLGGPVFDLYGPRWMMTAGCILLTLGVMMTSLATEYWQFIMSLSILTGIGTSLVFTPSFAAPGHWFLRRRGLATGVAATGGSVGGIIFPLMLQQLIPKIGFQWSLRVLGFIIFSLSFTASLLVRSRLPPLPDSNVWPDTRIFKQAPFTLLTLSSMLMELSLFVPITYISSYAVDMGLGTGLSYKLVAILNAGSFFGRALAGFVADVVGRFNTLAFCIFACFVSCVALWLPAGNSVALLIVFAVIFGIASGSNIMVSIGPLIGVPVGGTILQANNGHYWGLITFTSVVYGASVVLVVIGRCVARDWKITTVF
ncbi:hypothetical protein Cpir12675_001393 [Ceratocystis pirilliformis]|uniref:Major facilitator superfamily (MFS) profile domain-containing protein n=1 Tax=Ceratocystis pirilliformis TaxID=259994 RepID=A0ABR3ZHE2_9PEZI